MSSANKTPYISIIITFLLSTIIAWILSIALYSYSTNFGQIYKQSLQIDTSGYGKDRVTIQGTEEYYDRFWMESEQIYRYDIYIGGTTALMIYIGRIENIQKFANEKLFANCHFNKSLGHAIFWAYSGTASRKLIELYGEKSTEGYSTIVGFTDDNKLMPYARDVDIVIPKGGLNPLISLLIDQATTGLNTSIDSKISKAMNIQVVEEITSKLELIKLNKTLEKIAFLYGPIQFTTVFLLFFCLTVLFTSMWQLWAIQVTEGMLDLIPYVGFFGTLLGMGAALVILGNANLSDPISKAISLGPIGSKLALAIETTKFALVCFGIGTFFIVLRNSFKKDHDKIPRKVIINTKEEIRLD